MGVPIPPQMIEQMRQQDGERTIKFAEMLGLHPSFAANVLNHGQKAIIDRAQTLDETGAHGRLLSMVQRLGMWMQEKAEADEPPPQPGETIEAIAAIADQHGVNRMLALRLLGSTLEVFQQATSLLGRTEYANPGDNRTNTSGRGRGELEPSAGPIGAGGAAGGMAAGT